MLLNGGQSTLHGGPEQGFSTCGTLSVKFMFQDSSRFKYEGYGVLTLEGMQTFLAKILKR